MMDQAKDNLSRFAQTAAAWVGIGGAAFGVLSFCMLLGMWFGPLKELPAQYSSILAKLNTMDSRMDKTDWAIESLKSRADALASQLIVSSDDRAKIWDRIRVIDSEVLRIKASSLSREDTIEWMAALGARNKTLSIPPLSKYRE